MYKSLVLIFLSFLFTSPQVYGEPADIIQRRSIKVGVILPLSGQYARLGEDARRAIEMNADGDPTLEFFFEDSRFRAIEAISAYNKLKHKDGIEALINLDSVSFKALNPLLTRDQILTFQLAESVNHQDDTVFQIMPSSFPIYTKLGEVSQKLYRRIALIYGSSEFLVLDAEHFKDGIPADQIVFEQMLPSTPDYRSLVTRLLSKNPDASTFFLNPEDGIRFLRALREQGGSKKLQLICDANTEINIAKYVEALGPEMFEGCLSASLPNRMADQFKDRFKKKYGSEPAIFSDYSYDAVTLLKLLRDKPKNSWKRFIAGYRFAGVSGEIAFDEKGTRFPDVEMRIYRKGKFEKYSK